MIRIQTTLLCALVATAAVSNLGSAYAADAHFSPWQHPLSALPMVERIKVPVGPAWLETGYGSLWVSKIDSGSVLRIDPATNKVVATIKVGSHPELGIGIGLGSVWIADTKDRSVTQIDPKTNKIVRTIPANIPDETEGSIGVGEGSLWLLTNDNSTDSGTLSRLDPSSGKVTANIAVKPKSHAATVAFGSVWVAGAHELWVLSQSDGTIARIDPRSNRVVATIEVGVPGEGGDLSIGAGYVWVSAEGVPLSQIDPRTNKLIRQYVGGTRADTLRVGFGSAWVLEDLTGQIWKISLDKLSNAPVSGSKQQ